MAGTTYRAVAVAAEVPLGSMTYHFPNRDDLIFAAFERFADENFSPLDRAMSSPGTDPREALTRLVVDDDDARTRIILAELYVLAFRHDRYRDLMRQWMNRASEAIARRIDGVSPRVVDAVHVGLGLHHWLLPDNLPEGLVRGVFEALIPEPTDPSSTLD